MNDDRAVGGATAPPMFEEDRSGSEWATSTSGAQGLEPILVTAREAASLLGISRSRVFELLTTGELPSLTIGRSRRIPLDLLVAWVRDRVNGQSEKHPGSER